MILWKSQRRRKFKEDIRNTIILSAFAVLIVFSMLFYFLINYVGADIVARQTNQSNENVRGILIGQFDAYESFLNTLEQEVILETYLLYGESEYRLYEKLYSFVNQQQIGSVFYIVSPEGLTLITNTFAESPYREYDIFLTGIFKQMKKTPDQIVMKLNKQQLSSNARTVYSIGKAFRVGDEIVGYLVFDLLEADLNHLIQDAPVDVMVITDEYRNAIVTTTNTVLDSIGKFKLIMDTPSYTYSVRDEKHYVIKDEIYQGRIQLYSLSSHRFLNTLYVIGVASLLLITLVLAVLIGHLSERLSTKKTEALKRLLLAIENVQQGDLETKLAINSGDEFEQVGDYFNKMLSNLKVLIEKNNELLGRNNRAEIKQLEAQFNPHFLFNALESLKYLIRMKSSETDDFILNLAKLLRYSIENTENFVTLGKDLTYIESYLCIQKQRFGNRLDYSIELVDDVNQCVLPKLIIQPLVENCIHHGYFLKTQLAIKIIGYKEDDNLKIRIEDNGDGIDPVTLEEINRLLNTNENESEHIGLYNVHRRIKLQYGEDFGLQVTSTHGVGTLIEITLPYLQKGHRYD